MFDHYDSMDYMRTFRFVHDFGLISVPIIFNRESRRVSRAETTETVLRNMARFVRARTAEGRT